MPFLPNLKKKKRTSRSAESNAIASQVKALSMYKRTGESSSLASGSFTSFTDCDCSDDEDTGGIGSVDPSSLNNASSARHGSVITTASSHDRDKDKKRRRLIYSDDDYTDHIDHDALDVPSNRKRQRNVLGGGVDYRSPLVPSKNTSSGIGRYASPMYSPPEADRYSGAPPIRPHERDSDPDGGWACDSCWNLNEAQVERCSVCNQLQKMDQKIPPRKKSEEKEADENDRVDSSSLSTNKTRKVKVPRRISGEVSRCEQYLHNRIQSSSLTYVSQTRLIQLAPKSRHLSSRSSRMPNSSPTFAWAMRSGRR